MSVIEAPPVAHAATAQPPRPPGTVHVIGAGPVGLFLTALLQSFDGQQVRMYERREEYTRTRMVSLAEYLTADSIDSYRTDPIDGQNVEAIFDRSQLEAGLAYRRTISSDLRALLADWTRGFVPLNTIEHSLSDLIDSRDTGTVERVAARLDVGRALAVLQPGDVLVDATGSRSLMRDLLLPGDDLSALDRNTTRFRMEHALVITFLYDQDYQCNEFCKYYKNVGNTAYKFIPAVRRTHYDGSISHVTGIVGISEDQFQAMPPTCDAEFLRERLPDVALSMDRFIDKITAETHGKIISDLRVVRIPLDLYRARNVTSQAWQGSGIDHPLAGSSIFLLGDAALGSPYFQSISLGREAAFVLSRHIGNPALSIDDVFHRWEEFMYRQWMRVYMRTQMIKHNKDLLESVGDNYSLSRQDARLLSRDSGSEHADDRRPTEAPTGSTIPAGRASSSWAVARRAGLVSAWSSSWSSSWSTSTATTAPPVTCPAPGAASTARCARRAAASRRGARPADPAHAPAVRARPDVRGAPPGARDQASAGA